MKQRNDGKCPRCGTAPKVRVYCRPCGAAYARERRRRNPQKPRKVYRRKDGLCGACLQPAENDKDWRCRACNRARSKATKGRHKRWPRKGLAAWRDRQRKKLQDAVRAKKIIRLPCVECGAKAEAHHEDYTKPLQVMWLCHDHHKELHSRIKRAAKRPEALASNQAT